MALDAANTFNLVSHHCQSVVESTELLNRTEDCSHLDDGTAIACEPELSPN